MRSYGSYRLVGVFGALMVLAGRLLQGISTGGEVGASTTLQAEHAPPHQRRILGTWQLASQGLAVLVAAATAFIVTDSLTPAEVPAWGWRVPFLLGIVIVPVGLRLHRALRETHANDADAQTRSVSSLQIALRPFPARTLAGVGLVVGGTAANGIIVPYMAAYAVTKPHLAPSAGPLTGITVGLVTLVAAQLGGALSDRVGRKPVMLQSYLLLPVLIFPAFLLLNAAPGPPTLLLVAGLWALNAGGGATVIITLAEIFLVQVRAPAWRWSMRWALPSLAASASSR